jgi:hypothetical protein
MGNLAFHFYNSILTVNFIPLSSIEEFMSCMMMLLITFANSCGKCVMAVLETIAVGSEVGGHLYRRTFPVSYTEGTSGQKLDFQVQ